MPKMPTANSNDVSDKPQPADEELTNNVIPLARN